jgi:acyl dehydratase
MTAVGRGIYFDDFKLGDVFETGRRTITTTDIVNFSCLSGDFNGVHADWEYCKTTPFGEPIAHGPLVYGIAAGLVYASGINDGSLIALLGIKEWTMTAPVKNGDTIRMQQEVTNLQQTRKPGRGVVTFDRRILNQRNELVQRMTASYLYHARPAAQ